MRLELSLEIGVRVVTGPRRGGGHSRRREEPTQRLGEGCTVASETKERRYLKERGGQASGL